MISKNRLKQFVNKYKLKIKYPIINEFNVHDKYGH